MLSPVDYEALVVAILQSGAEPFTDAATYLSTHHLPNWYPAIADLTPETRIFPNTADLAAKLHALDWPAYFIKDYKLVLQRAFQLDGDLVAGLEMQRFAVARGDDELAFGRKGGSQ